MNTALAGIQHGDVATMVSFSLFVVCPWLLCTVRETCCENRGVGEMYAQAFIYLAQKTLRGIDQIENH